jgi:hypothetical protein
VDPVETAQDARDKHDGLNTWIAIVVALLATFMGISKVKDDNIVQAMLQSKSDSVDRWGQYQAKSTREYLAGIRVDELKLRQADAAELSPARAKALQDSLVHWQAEGRRYEREKADVRKQAEDLEAQYDALNVHDDQFDLSDALLSVAVALLAVTALTRKKQLFFVALVFSFFGLLMGLAGLVGWGLHPGALMRLLS